jgi:flagellar basal-body rod modification protein FlgD
VTTPITGTYNSVQPAQTAPTSDASSKDMFMKLLVAQLKYQNPMQPTDGNEYMNQMAIFTQVEKLGQLVQAQQTSQQWQQRMTAQALVGKQVTGTAADKSTHTGIVTKVDFANATLTLSDGSSLAVEDVTTVEQP